MSDHISPVHYGALVAVVASTRVTGAGGEGRKLRSGAAASNLQIQGQPDAHCSLQASAAGMLHSGDTK